jgi:polyhydroxyalkanoate synthesis regulator phasin
MTARSRGSDAADAVRTAVDRTFQATVGQAQVTRERAQELVDDVTQAAGRVREVLEDLRVATRDDLRDLRRELRALERRVAELEQRKPARASTGRRTTQAKRSTARKPATKSRSS